MSILNTIIAHKRAEVEARKACLPLSSMALVARFAPQVRDFRSALVNTSHPGPRVIAEIKRRSPSKGVLRRDLDPAQVARVYERNGAAALSVLTDSRFFGGSLEDLSSARDAVSIPVMCKEFIVDPYQVYEARLAGADAVLLLASVLGTESLREFRELCSDLGMAALVEVHDLAELASALNSGAGIIGVNNRDLRTFEVSLDVTRQLVAHIPSHVVTVSESGIQTASDRECIAALGVDAILIGEGLIAAPDVAAATIAMCGLLEPAGELALFGSAR